MEEIEYLEEYEEIVMPHDPYDLLPVDPAFDEFIEEDPLCSVYRNDFQFNNNNNNNSSGTVASTTNNNNTPINHTIIQIPIDQTTTVDHETTIVTTPTSTSNSNEYTIQDIDPSQLSLNLQGVDDNDIHSTIIEETIDNNENPTNNIIYGNSINLLAAAPSSAALQNHRDSGMKVLSRKTIDTSAFLNIKNNINDNPILALSRGNNRNLNNTTTADYYKMLNNNNNSTIVPPPTTTINDNSTLPLSGQYNNRQNQMNSFNNKSENILASTLSKIDINILAIGSSNSIAERLKICQNDINPFAAISAGVKSYEFQKSHVKELQKLNELKESNYKGFSQYREESSSSPVNDQDESINSNKIIPNLAIKSSLTTNNPYKYGTYRFGMNFFNNKYNNLLKKSILVNNNNELNENQSSNDTNITSASPVITKASLKQFEEEFTTNSVNNCNDDDDDNSIDSQINKNLLLSQIHNINETNDSSIVTNLDENIQEIIVTNNLNDDTIIEYDTNCQLNNENLVTDDDENIIINNSSSLLDISAMSNKTNDLLLVNNVQNLTKIDNLLDENLIIAKSTSLKSHTIKPSYLIKDRKNVNSGSKFDAIMKPRSFLNKQIKCDKTIIGTTATTTTIVVSSITTPSTTVASTTATTISTSSSTSKVSTTVTSKPKLFKSFTDPNCNEQNKAVVELDIKEDENNMNKNVLEKKQRKSSASSADLYRNTKLINEVLNSSKVLRVVLPRSIINKNTIEIQQSQSNKINKKTLNISSEIDDTINDNPENHVDDVQNNSDKEVENILHNIENKSGKEIDELLTKRRDSSKSKSHRKSDKKRDKKQSTCIDAFEVLHKKHKTIKSSSSSSKIEKSLNLQQFDDGDEIFEKDFNQSIQSSDHVIFEHLSTITPEKKKTPPQVDIDGSNPEKIDDKPTDIRNNEIEENVVDNSKVESTINTNEETQLTDQELTKSMSTNWKSTDIAKSYDESKSGNSKSANINMKLSETESESKSRSESSHKSGETRHKKSGESRHKKSGESRHKSSEARHKSGEARHKSGESRRHKSSKKKSSKSNKTKKLHRSHKSNTQSETKDQETNKIDQIIIDTEGKNVQDHHQSTNLESNVIENNDTNYIHQCPVILPPNLDKSNLCTSKESDKPIINKRRKSSKSTDIHKEIMPPNLDHDTGSGTKKRKLSKENVVEQTTIIDDHISEKIKEIPAKIQTTELNDVNKINETTGNSGIKPSVQQTKISEEFNIINPIEKTINKSSTKRIDEKILSVDKVIITKEINKHENMIKSIVKEQQPIKDVVLNPINEIQQNPTSSNSIEENFVQPELNKSKRKRKVKVDSDVIDTKTTPPAFIEPIIMTRAVTKRAKHGAGVIIAPEKPASKIIRRRKSNIIQVSRKEYERVMNEKLHANAMKNAIEDDKVMPILYPECESYFHSTNNMGENEFLRMFKIKKCRVNVERLQIPASNKKLKNSKSILVASTSGDLSLNSRKVIPTIAQKDTINKGNTIKETLESNLGKSTKRKIQTVTYDNCNSKKTAKQTTQLLTNPEIQKSTVESVVSNIEKELDENTNKRGRGHRRKKLKYKSDDLYQCKAIETPKSVINQKIQTAVTPDQNINQIISNEVLVETVFKNKLELINQTVPISTSEVEQVTEVLPLKQMPKKVSNETKITHTSANKLKSAPNLGALSQNAEKNIHKNTIIDTVKGPTLNLKQPVEISGTVASGCHVELHSRSSVEVDSSNSFDTSSTTPVQILNNTDTSNELVVVNKCTNDSNKIKHLQQDGNNINKSTTPTPVKENSKPQIFIAVPEKSTRTTFVTNSENLTSNDIIEINDTDINHHSDNNNSNLLSMTTEQNSVNNVSCLMNQTESNLDFSIESWFQDEPSTVTEITTTPIPNIITLEEPNNFPNLNECNITITEVPSLIPLSQPPSLLSTPTLLSAAPTLFSSPELLSSPTIIEPTLQLTSNSLPSIPNINSTMSTNKPLTKPISEILPIVQKKVVFSTPIQPAPITLPPNIKTVNIPAHIVVQTKFLTRDQYLSKIAQSNPTTSTTSTTTKSASSSTENGTLSSVNESPQRKRTTNKIIQRISELIESQIDGIVKRKKNEVIENKAVEDRLKNERLTNVSKIGYNHEFALQMFVFLQNYFFNTPETFDTFTNFDSIVSALRSNNNTNSAKQTKQSISSIPTACTQQRQQQIQQQNPKQQIQQQKPQIQQQKQQIQQQNQQIQQKQQQQTNEEEQNFSFRKIRLPAKVTTDNTDNNLKKTVVASMPPPTTNPNHSRSLRNAPPTTNQSTLHAQPTISNNPITINSPISTNVMIPNKQNPMKLSAQVKQLSHVPRSRITRHNLELSPAAPPPPPSQSVSSSTSVAAVVVPPKTTGSHHLMPAITLRQSTSVQGEQVNMEVFLNSGTCGTNCTEPESILPDDSQTNHSLNQEPQIKEESDDDDESVMIS